MVGRYADSRGSSARSAGYLIGYVEEGFRASLCSGVARRGTTRPYVNRALDSANEDYDNAALRCGPPDGRSRHHWELTSSSCQHVGQAPTSSAQAACLLGTRRSTASGADAAIC